MATETDPAHLLASLTQEELDALLRHDLSAFTQTMFSVLKPGERLIWAPYLDLVCSALQDVAFGRTSHLVITLPPRFLKSICASVALPAFFLGHNPSAEVMCVSYSTELAKQFAEQTRTAMISPVYKRLFETRLTSERSAPHLLRTTAGGVRRATSIDGAATGLGANLNVFDDPQKAGEAFSDAIRRATNRAFENTFISRQNDPRNVRIVIVMQRLHEEDFVGHVTGLAGNWRIINLPAVAETDEIWRYDTVLGSHAWTRKEGESLHPERFPADALQTMRATVGEAVWATQWQQRPAPAGGGIVKRAWFRQLPPDQMPLTFERKIQSWDTAIKIEDWNDFSVCTTWGIASDKLYLLNVFRKRLEYPDLKRAIVEKADFFKPELVLLEDKASGQQLLQELPRIGFMIAKAMEPEGDKAMRMGTQTAVIENGCVYVPADAGWLPEYLYEMEVFPNGRFNDQVDSTSQFLAWHNNCRIAFFNLREFTRQEAERVAGGRTKAETWILFVPLEHRSSTFYLRDGSVARADTANRLQVTRENAEALLRLPGFTRVDAEAE